ncbi:hypothetical protein [Cellulomonas sp. JZ18]|uniref:hypothetical protein n=1 Tax=Cellulomonas sp. JZ18 TaxID=2654191 RepID=UPI0012D486F5|nr:hypothetical protein [Cellulomonas sp. JZ18]
MDDHDDHAPDPDRADRLRVFRPVRGWSVLWRGAFGVRHVGAEWVVDVDYLDPDERVRLYRDGTLVDERRSPARFPLGDGARVEAALSTWGMRRVRLVTPDGARDLEPLPGTAEAWRDRVDREHPAASRLVAAAAWCVLAVGAVAQLPALLGLVERGLGMVGASWDAPALWEPSGRWVPWLAAAAVVAALDRGLRRRWSPWLDD